MRLRAALLVLVLASPLGASLGPLADDAGSGRDAPDQRADALRIEPGRLYRGVVLYPVDIVDLYRFHVVAGQRIEVHQLGPGTAWSVERPDGSTAGGTFVVSDGWQFVADATGDWFLRVALDGAYEFSVGLDQRAPRTNVGGPQDDAGSGRDAPSSAAEAPIPIETGRTYAGSLPPNDLGDRFGFHAEAGDRLVVTVAGAVQARVTGPLGSNESASSFHGGARLRHQVVHPGPWMLFVWGAGDYTFRVARHPFGVEPATKEGDHVVVAVIDTGINPYHAFFRAPALVDHPSTWLPGFPASAESLALTFGASSTADAVARDAATWSGVQRSTYDELDAVPRLYTFPGTRIVGALSFAEYGDAWTPPGVVPILDENGHGTHSAGLALGVDTDDAAGDVLLVAIEIAGGGEIDAAVAWAARQPWIDAISLSFGWPANVPTSGTIGGLGPFERASREAAQAGKAVLVASGNGLTNTGFLPDRCTTATSPMTGPPWITRIGAASPEDGNPMGWHCVPVDAIAHTNVPSPSHLDDATFTNAGGTSASTPNVAGHLARLLLDARRVGLDLNAGTALPHLLNASEPARPSPGWWTTPGPRETAFFSEGFGLVDDDARRRAAATLLSGLPPRERPDMETWRWADHAVRHHTHGEGKPSLGQLPLPPLPPTPDVQNDAGRGRDAPDVPDPSFTIPSGGRFTGTILGSFLLANSPDKADHYAFAGRAGDVIEAHVTMGACVGIVRADGTSPPGLRPTCPLAGTTAIRGTLDADGTWYVQVLGLTGGPYRFSLGTGPLV